jgi:hypothetical protein
MQRNTSPARKIYVQGIQCINQIFFYPGSFLDENLELDKFSQMEPFLMDSEGKWEGSRSYVKRGGLS